MAEKKRDCRPSPASVEAGVGIDWGGTNVALGEGRDASRTVFNSSNCFNSSSFFLPRSSFALTLTWKMNTCISWESADNTPYYRSQNPPKNHFDRNNPFGFNFIPNPNHSLKENYYLNGHPDAWQPQPTRFHFTSPISAVICKNLVNSTAFNCKTR